MATKAINRKGSASEKLACNKSEGSPKKKPNSDPKGDEKEPEPVKLRYGPLPSFSEHKNWARAVILMGVIIYAVVYTKTRDPPILAKQNEVWPSRGQSFACSSSYLTEIHKFPNCLPSKCGRHVSDNLVTKTEAETLLSVAKKGIALGGSNGGASILDLHSGALSKGEKFINVYSLENATFLTASDLAVYKLVKNKIRKAISEIFQVEAANLYLTHPTFFSKLTNDEPVSDHDHYWHWHVDKETYEAFHYTSLLYLTDYGIDFTGGRLVFDTSHQVEPRRGRVLMFTSGAENTHHVERVESGIRYAITISFTCDKSKAVGNPVGRQ